MTCYVFGEWELNSTRHMLCRAGEAVQLRKQLFDVLGYLLEHHDRVVSPEQLIKFLWPQQYVDPEHARKRLDTVMSNLGKGLLLLGRTKRSLRMWKAMAIAVSPQWRSIVVGSGGLTACVQWLSSRNASGLSHRPTVA